jgi:hypothetical protein
MKSIILFLLLFIGCTNNTGLDVKMGQVYNDTNHIWNIWVYDNDKWYPISVLKPGDVGIICSNNKEVWLTVKNELGQEFPIGKINVYKVLENNPNYQWKLSNSTTM